MIARLKNDIAGKGIRFFTDARHKAGHDK